MRTPERLALTLAVSAMTWIPCSAARAEEGAAGHYAPGAAASFIDAFPGKPGHLGLIAYYTHYQGSAESNVQIPMAGLVTLGLDATSHSATVVALYQTNWRVGGGYWATGVAVPFVWLDAAAAVTTGLGTRGQTDSDRGIGDLAFYPLMLGWVEQGGDLKYDVRLGVYAPTGAYQKNKLANLGKHYWTFEPGFFVTYFGSKNGREVTAYTAFDINTTNTDTDYRTGTQFHVDATLAQHLPLLGGAVGLGANGFYYLQIDGDTKSGATLGNFKGRTAGVGPVLSYLKATGTGNFVAEVKWLPELDVDKRLEGDFIWVKLGYLF